MILKSAKLYQKCATLKMKRTHTFLWRFFFTHPHYSFFLDVNEESPPEPAPPEVPPRGPSLHSATLRRRNEYALPVGDVGGQENQESQFLQQGGGKSTRQLYINVQSVRFARYYGGAEVANQNDNGQVSLVQIEVKEWSTVSVGVFTKSIQIQRINNFCLILQRLYPVYLS